MLESTEHSAELIVIVPTLYEADNLPELTQRIFAAVSTAVIATELLIVDDNSQDGTEGVVKQLAGQYPIRLITRTLDRGLATAVLHGIRQSRHDYVIVMDADLSHPPEDIPRLFRRLKEGADFVVGSRYVKGGSTDAKWSSYRWLNSKVAVILARGLTDLKDPTAGFFGFRRSILASAPQLVPVGYKIALEILVKGNCRKVEEIPIAFSERTKGESKLTLRQQFLYLRHLRRLYRFQFPQTSEIIQFATVGGSGVVIDLFFFLALTYGARIDHQLSRAMSFFAAVSWNWYLNRWFTFVGGRDKKWGRQWIEFLATALVGFTINWGSYKLLTDYVPYLAQHHIVAFFLGILLGTGSNYMLSRWFVFRPFDKVIAASQSVDDCYGGNMGVDK
jgi:dolichol-phosphate mannosyltransferase